ncbi:MAG: hypothetical protein A2270_09665 [Elusimicrobia bacterium RIFOXYA12_FULL_51_18]|nr:MAG: hypothetical protein A2270_09665 [Elusimicrobia bacterium RIFOXYA12_FULL_51_18]OGS32769.1 MAG: hypothetical protein A2218_11980 [Elusimicrobia bacterium RIFOXYA2_FULL_53_38]
MNKFADKLKSFVLVLRIFLKVTRMRLYYRVFANAIKNAAGLHSPSSAVIGLTYMCQLRCSHCSAGLYKRETAEELSTAQWLAILGAISDVGVPRLNISGGEALLRKDIFDIIRFASRHFVTVLESNGLLLTEGTLLDLKTAGVSCVAVSIDVPDPKEHDALRNNAGCFKSAIQGLKNCVKAAVPCLISTYVTSKRADAQGDIHAIIKLARDLGVMAVRVMPARPVGSFQCHAAETLNPKQEKELLKNLDPCITYFKGLPAPDDCGIFKRSTFYVSPYGEIQPCAYLPLTFGSALKGPLATTLDKMWSHTIFKVPHKDCLIIDPAFRNRHIPSGENVKGKFPLEIK